MRPRQHIRNRFVLIGDIALILVSVLGSFALRLDVGELPYYFPAVLLMSAVALAIKIPVFFFFGLYRLVVSLSSRKVLSRLRININISTSLTPTHL